MSRVKLASLASPAFEQCLPDLAGDPGGEQDLAGFFHEGRQGAGVDGAGVARYGEDDLGSRGGQGLDVVQLVVAAFLQRHDAAGGVGGVDFLRPGRRPARRRPAGRRRSPRGLWPGTCRARLTSRSSPMRGTGRVPGTLPGGGPAGAVLQPGGGRCLPSGEGGFLLLHPGGELRDPGLELLLALAPPAGPRAPRGRLSAAPAPAPPVSASSSPSPSRFAAAVAVPAVVPAPPPGPRRPACPASIRGTPRRSGLPAPRSGRRAGGGHVGGHRGVRLQLVPSPATSPAIPGLPRRRLSPTPAAAQHRVQCRRMNSAIVECPGAGPRR